MKKLKIALAVLMATTSFNVTAGGMEDDPLLAFFKADQLEIRDTDEGNVTVMELDAWVGKDLEKLWFKYTQESFEGNTESSELDIMYSKALTAFWDVQYGVRTILEPSNGDTWLGVSFMGVAPYLFEVDANVFVNSDGNINARIDAEYEYLFTQKLALVPNVELGIYTKDDAAAGIESGFATLEMGTRLQYRIKRDFVPYAGVNFEKTFGTNAASETQLVAGISFWF